jgi:tRNA dimethylallyltransferase
VPELTRFLRGEISRREAILAAKRASRNYAKRQYTWLRHRMAGSLVIDEQYSESIKEKIFSFIRPFLLTPD